MSISAPLGGRIDAITDLTLDGDMDLLRDSTEGVRVCQGVGVAQFSPGNAYAAGVTLAAVAGDMDGNGTIDIVSLSEEASTVTVHLSLLTPPPPACPGDINGDGFTNVGDFNILAGNYAQSVVPNTDGDLTGDGFVNVADFNILAGDFGCGPS